MRDPCAPRLLVLLLLLPPPRGCPRAAQDPAQDPAQDAGTPPPPPASPSPQVLPACGFSFERDPTLRDPEAMTRRWPWMVSVQVNGAHVCAGTLISSQWVLASAHCLTKPGANYTVRLGSPWIDRVAPSTVDVPVLRVVINSRFRPQRYWSWIGQANNIGLLKLQHTLKYSKYIRPVCLPGLDYELEDQALCVVTGWGHPHIHGAWPQFLTIQEKEVSILSSRECDNIYHQLSKIPSLVQIITSQMICIKDPGREKFCYELTGEPLVCSTSSVGTGMLSRTWYLVGMMSWGPGCKYSDSPPIFLRVTSYQQWIWDRLSGQPLAQPALSRALLLAMSVPLSLLAAL